MEIHLSGEQGDELRRLLNEALGELSTEIAGTENPAFQRSLRGRRQLLEDIETQLNTDAAQ